MAKDLQESERPSAFGSLSIVRPAVSSAHKSGFETFIRIDANGTITAFNGHVDLGTGIRTALGQIVAEELDVSFARVVVVLGDTAHTPNQGATIASETIQITAIPLRQAAATARRRPTRSSVWPPSRPTASPRPPKSRSR